MFVTAKFVCTDPGDFPYYNYQYLLILLGFGLSSCRQSPKYLEKAVR